MQEILTPLQMNKFIHMNNGLIVSLIPINEKCAP